MKTTLSLWCVMLTLCACQSETPEQAPEGPSPEVQGAAEPTPSDAVSAEAPSTGVCPGDALAELEARASSLPERERPAEVARGLLEACDLSTLPEALEAGLERVTALSPPNILGRWSDVSREDRALLSFVLQSEVCTGAKPTPKEQEKLRAIYARGDAASYHTMVPRPFARCAQRLKEDPGFKPLLGDEEEKNGDSSAHSFFYTLLYHWMERGDVDTSRARTLLRSAAMVRDADQLRRESVNITLISSVGGHAPERGSVEVRVEPDRLRVQGREVLKLKEGRVPRKFKRGGAAGITVAPLKQQLRKESRRARLWAQRQNEVFAGARLVVLADAKTSFRTLTEILVTADLSDFKLLALSTHQTDALSESGSTATPERYPFPLAHIPVDVRHLPGDAPRLHVDRDGFTLWKDETRLPPAEGCPGPATLCPRDPDANDPLARHDWLRLYNALVTLKQSGDLPTDTRLGVSFEGDAPLGLVVRTLDLVRHHYAAPGQELADLETLLASTPVEGAPLFPDVSIGQERRFKKEGRELAIQILGVPGDDDDIASSITGDIESREGIEFNGSRPSEPGKTITVKESKLHAPRVSSKNAKAMQAVFSKKKRQISNCYERFISKHGPKDGKITVKVSISASGKVLGVKTPTNTIGPSFETCVSQKIKRWSFPKQDTEVTVAKRWVLKG